MENRLEKLNIAYKKALGEVLLKEFSHVAHLSVSDVIIDPSTQTGRVYLATDPDILNLINQRRGDIQQQLTKYIQTRYTPKFSFVIDDNYLNHIDQLFDSIKK